MQTYKTMNDVIALAEFAHRKQTDQAGLPYIEHPRRVMESVRAQGALPYVQMAAILHDVTEDTAFTIEMLFELGVPGAALDLVALLDRKLSYAEYQSISYCDVEAVGEDRAQIVAEWTERMNAYYYAAIKRNHDARMIKLADIADNTQEWRLSYLPAARQMKLREKYANARVALGSF